MHRKLIGLLSFLAWSLAACGESPSSTPQQQGEVAAPAATMIAASTPPAGRAADAPNPGFANRSGELVNPDDRTMVFLYFDLAGISPPIDRWVEEDFSVLSAPAIERAERRTVLKAELEAGAASVRQVGLLRLSLHDARLSDYDPGYGEFTVRALAPSSVIEFSEFRQKVQLKFSNGKAAQIWKVPADEAQAVRDRVGSHKGAELDTLMKIVDVQPGANGGVIVVEILEYELRDKASGTTLARVQLAP